MIVVAGEALVDLLARPDGSLVATPGGGPYTTARAIARLGVPVAWLGGLSRDRFGRELEAALTADRVALDLVRRTDLPTTLALAELDADGAATYRFYLDGTSAGDVGAAGADAIDLPAGTRALHVGTLGLVLEPLATTVEAIVDRLAPDVVLFVDPNCRPAAIADRDAYRRRLTRILGRADVVKVSVEDLAFLRPGDDPLAAAAWIGALGASAVLLTDGGGPVRVLVGQTVATVDVPVVTVVDTVGAGDTFGGATLAALVHGGAGRAGLDVETVLEAVRVGVRASSMSCTRAGANPPTLDEIGGWPAR